MTQEKENLKKLVVLIDSISKIKGNEWFINELSTILSQSKTKVKNIDISTKIEQISELCIEDIIKRQADEFYKKIGNITMASSLANDFKLMEHFKRRDDFCSFSFCLYQQLENMINFYVKKNKNDIVHFYENRKKSAFSKFSNELYGYSLQNLIINKYFSDEKRYYNSNDYDLFFSQDRNRNFNSFSIKIKFRFALYYGYYNRFVYQSKDFKQMEDIFGKIKVVRDSVHRGSEFYNKRDNEILNDTLNNRYSNYLLFYGFLENFISTLISRFNEDVV